MYYNGHLVTKFATWGQIPFAEVQSARRPIRENPPRVTRGCRWPEKEALPWCRQLGCVQQLSGLPGGRQDTLYHAGRGQSEGAPGTTEGLSDHKHKTDACAHTRTTTQDAEEHSWGLNTNDCPCHDALCRSVFRNVTNRVI